ncbi:hypothetical protein ScalyP_jg6857 [Parmales sp. scaly parma]|nr:hypothetical protein ScalyP_jg6857 [Parmales sp. scaly parma]
MAKKKKQDTPNAAPTSQSIGDVALAGLKKFKEEEEERIKFTVMPQRLVAARKDSAEALNQMREQKQLIKYQKEDQNDVYFFLHKKLDDNYDIIAELEAQLLKEELDRKKQEEKILKEIDEDNKSFKESSAGLKERLTAVDEKLYALKETDGTKSSMEKKMHHLLNDLESERKAHFSKLAEIDRIGIREKEKLKMVILAEMKAVKDKLSTMTSETLANTKNTARSNHSMHGDKLHQQGLIGTEIMKANLEVSQNVAKKKRDIQLSNEIQATMVSREIAFQKQISSLTQKLQDLGLEAEEASSEVVDARDEMSIEEQTLLDAVNELHSTLDATVANMQHQKEKADAAVESYNMEIWSSDLRGVPHLLAGRL